VETSPAIRTLFQCLGLLEDKAKPSPLGISSKLFCGKTVPVQESYSPFPSEGLLYHSVCHNCDSILCGLLLAYAQLMLMRLVCRIKQVQTEVCC